MPVLQFGSKMKSPYLEQWRPEPGTLTTISLLSLNPIGTRSHWVDVPELSIKDRCQCVEGFCCKAFGQAWLTYFFPIWVYDNPGSVEGTFFTFAATPTQYRNIVNLAKAGDLLTFDVQVQVVQQGTGYQTSYTLMPNSTLRSSMSEEMKAKIKESIDVFYKEEEKLCRSMTAESYNSLLQKVNYDFHSGLPLIKKTGSPTQNPGFFPGGIPGAPPQPPNPGYPQAPQASIPNVTPTTQTAVEVPQIPPKEVTSPEVPSQPQAPHVTESNLVTPPSRPAPVTPEEIQSMLS